jgi:hypothetical protein
MGRYWTRIPARLGFGCLFLLLAAAAGPQSHPLRISPDGLATSGETPVAAWGADAPIPASLQSPPDRDAKILGESQASWAGGHPAKASRKGTRAAKSPAARSLDLLVKEKARRNGVEESLVWAVMRQESGFHPRAVSPKGALGLMQLMPATAALMGVSDPFDAEENIAGGVKYLKLCLTRFDQDVALALAAYNAGPENVLKYQGCPPFPETQNYVAAVLRVYSGKVPPKGLRFKNASYSRENSAPGQAPGLPWRVPAPQWKIAGPQFKVQALRWQGRRGPS